MATKFKPTVEQSQVLGDAVTLLCLASGDTAAGTRQSIEDEPERLQAVAIGLRAMSAVSPLADKIDVLCLEMMKPQV